MAAAWCARAPSCGRFDSGDQNGEGNIFLRPTVCSNSAKTSYKTRLASRAQRSATRPMFLQRQQINLQFVASSVKLDGWKPSVSPVVAGSYARVNVVGVYSPGNISGTSPALFLISGAARHITHKNLTSSNKSLVYSAVGGLEMINHLNHDLDREGGCDDPPSQAAMIYGRACAAEG
ncbi:hypothetical protein J6590_012308 [Homalodisca vitripennis]|nr:hypothetical protein J6590_012308 [Homalodisca vitripennis]